MAVPSFYDDFNRVNNTTINANANWWAENGDVEISGNQLRNVAINPTKTYTIYSDTLVSNNYSVEAKIKSTGTTGHFGGIIGRWTNSSNYYVAYISWDDGKIYLKKNVATVLTTLGSITRTLAINTEYKLKLICNNTNIQVWFENEDMPLINVMDSSHSSGSVGLYGDSTSSASIYWDNFYVKQIYGTIIKNTDFVYQSAKSWKTEGNAQTSTSNPLLVLEYPIILSTSKNIIFYILPKNTWTTLPTTYVDGVNPSGIWTEFECRASSTDPSVKVKRYSYQETQQAMINDTWTPIKISGSNYALSVSGERATLRVYLALGEADKNIYVSAVPEITGIFFDKDLIG